MNWNEFIKDFGQLNANVMKTLQLEISRIQIFTLWLEPHV